MLTTKAASVLGKKGGLSKSSWKADAARKNGAAGGRPLSNPILNPARIASFWKLVKKRRGCWEWLGIKNKGGYGRFYLVTTRSKCVRIHAQRFSYLLHKGPVPVGACICHECDNPGCVNPKHLFLGTQTANMDDRHKKGRSPKGEKIGTSKLLERQVKDIISSFVPGFGGNWRELSERYNIHKTTIYRIVNRSLWKHVNDEPIEKS